MQITWASFGISLVLLAHQVCLSTSDEHEYRLVRDLMRTYDRRIRPSMKSSDALNVTFGLALAQVIDVDEKNQIITTNCWLNQVWVDFKLRWDPLKYGNISVIRIPYDAIWRPDILLYNNADVEAYGNSISTNVIVSNDGNVTWLSMVIFRSSCPINVRYFPFDEQNCTMQFASWTYDGFQVNLLKVGDDGDVSNYMPNSEWILINLHAERKVEYYSCCAEPYPDVTYKIQIRRKPLFYVFNMILPCLLITLVALLGFLIPSDSGEKVTMGITTLLSMTVFLMLVTESMPPTSDVLPLIGLYYGITIAIVSLATAMTVLTLNIHNKGIRGAEVPNGVRKLCLGFFAKLLFLHLDTKTGYGPQSEEEEEEEEQHINMFTSEPGDQNKRKPYIKLKRTGANGGVVQGRGNRSPITQDLPSPPCYRNIIGGRDATRLTSIDNPENGGISSRLRNLPFPSGSGHPASPTFGPSVWKADTARLSASNDIASSTDSDFERHFIRVLQKVYQTIGKNEIRLAEQDRRDAIKQEWHKVALVVDRIFLFIFIAITVAVTLGIMLCAPHSRANWTG